MENAGRESALLVEHLFPEGAVVALVGSGNNGGDALVCLRALAAWGRRVTAVLVGARPRPDPLLHGWEVPTLIFDREESGAATEFARVLAGASVVIDGLLGTGIRGAPRPTYAAVIEAANQAPGAVVALDTPSGVDGGNGLVPGAAVVADLTVAFGWPKRANRSHRDRVPPRWQGGVGPTGNPRLGLEGAPAPTRGHPQERGGFVGHRGWIGDAGGRDPGCKVRVPVRCGTGARVWIILRAGSNPRGPRRNLRRCE